MSEETSEDLIDYQAILQELYHELRSQDKQILKLNEKEERFNLKITDYQQEIEALEQGSAVLETQVEEGIYDKDRDDFDDEESGEFVDVQKVSRSKRKHKKKHRKEEDESNGNEDNEVVEENSSTESSDAAPAVPEKEDKKAPFDREILLDIITGIGVTIAARGQMVGSVDDVLLPFDFSYKHQFKMEVEGGDHKLLKFKDFAPKVFAQIRLLFGVSDDDYLSSFTLDNLKAIKGEGKSGAFFVFTKDKQFIVKTATDQERDFLWRNLPEYLKHIKKYPDTLLPRFYGVYSMKHEGIGGVIRFVVMQNIFCYPYQPVEKYDLKGSSVGRYVKMEKRKPGVILKDLDIKDANRKLWLSESDQQDWARQIYLDTKFLAEAKVMDYSLLIGVYYPNEDNQRDLKKTLRAFDKIDVWKNITKSRWMSNNGGIKGYNEEEDREEIYYIGIIDILVKYKAGKKFEHAMKSIAYDGDEVSVIHPKKYAERYCDFMLALLPNEDVAREAFQEIKDGLYVAPKKAQEKKKRKKIASKTTDSGAKTTDSASSSRRTKRSQTISKDSHDKEKPKTSRR